ncbi:hypothetical protein ABE473_14980 [Stenotrophomonas sp. TWI700]|uniref:hypothetical protein n=1 Tax=Stenotrophomonas sp. TWI700 TaxID=3136792 RepID=UPI00320AE124
MSTGKSRKSREKLADTLMSMSGALAVALTSAVFIAPMGLALAQLIKQEPLNVVALIEVVDSSTVALFFALFIAAAFIVKLGRRSAFKIYDSLYPDP